MIMDSVLNIIVMFPLLLYRHGDYFSIRKEPSVIVFVKHTGMAQSLEIGIETETCDFDED